MNAPRLGFHHRLAAAMVLVAAVGCGGSNTPIGRVTAAANATADLFRSITDPASATAAIPKLKPTFAEMGAANGELVKMLSDPGKMLSLMSSSQSEMEGMGKAMEALEAEATRIDKLKGLPADFWNVFRPEWYNSQAMVMDSAGLDEAPLPLHQVNGLYQTHGAQRVVELELRNSENGDVPAAIEKLRKLVPSDTQVIEFEDPSDFDATLVAVAPVEDFDKLIKSIEFGDVTDQEKAKGEATIELPDAAQEAVAETAEPSAEPAADPAQVTTDEYGNPVPPESFGENASAVGGQPNTLPGRFAGLAQSRFGNLATAVTVVVAAERAAIAERAANGPQRGDRDYHAAMAALLYEPQSPHHERALTELLEVKPADVTDRKVRARIANGYRQLAFAENSTHAGQAVNGLVHWGGKYSAPLLIQLLEKQSAGGGGGAEEALFNGLGKVATPEAAAAVIKRLESGSGYGGNEAAFAALKTMGPVAEDPLIKVLPFEQPESNRAAIEVLGEIGTRKSLALLRRATKSETPEVKDAALEALRSIQDRLRAEKPAAASASTK